MATVLEIVYYEHFIFYCHCDLNQDIKVVVNGKFDSHVLIYVDDLYVFLDQLESFFTFWVL